MDLLLGWKRLRHQLGLKRRWLTRQHRPYQPLFILGTGRCGSNLLLSFLSNQPGVSMRSELLRFRAFYGIWKHQATPARAIRHIRLSLHAAWTPIRGCKLMLNQLENCKLSLDELNQAFPSARYVILYRQNLAEQFVSTRLAYATRQFLLLPGQERQEAQTSVDPAELMRFCQYIRERYQQALSHPWLAERSVLLSYEELIDDPAYWLREQIGPLLGIAAALPETTLRKQNSRPLAATVSNYAEVAPLLADCRQRFGKTPSNRLAA